MPNERVFLLVSLIIGGVCGWRLPINTGKWIKSATASAIALSFQTHPSNAFGPTDVALEVVSYKTVELCNGQKPIMPGQKAMQGLFPVCIEVSADVNNPSKEELPDVSIYGFVKENDAGNSVLPNNPDFRSDSGQYAMIKNLKPGASRVTYQFVAAISADPSKEKIPELTFFKTKARAFPGGAKFEALSECEMDPRSCSTDDDE